MIRINSLLIPFFLFGAEVAVFGQRVKINNDSKEKVVVFGNDKINLTLDYNKKANVSRVTINGQPVISGQAGIYTTIRTKETTYSTLHLLSDPVIKISSNRVRVSNLLYGDKNLTINESWIFTINESTINLDIDRSLSKEIIVERVGLPVFVFDRVDTWEGAYQDYGGLAWFYLFNKKLDTYGVHSNSSRFWNSKTGNGLMIQIDAPGNQVAIDYCRTNADQMACSIAASPTEMQFRFDSDTKRRRYVRDTTEVWASFAMNEGKSHQRIALSYFNFKEQFGRGKLIGVNEAQVSAVSNTIARIGVIDKNHFGGNSWHTPYGPICLHEQYIAQMGLAINDNTYLKGYQQCLDFYRDNAIKEDGRVWPRWAYSNEDAMPQGFTEKGFYEAQWGYLLDSNPDFVTNVAELYDQSGDLRWVKTHQMACEKALEWIMKRDTNGNGLVEMMNDNHNQKRGSDWIDIIWAAYENAFVNAKLYHALVLWADVERQLGNATKENDYKQFAGKLKESFNKPISAGGFWDSEKKCYIHWREKDGSAHGNNMVTPVNFMAIAYGICDEEARRNKILDDIEVQMTKENLFFWPLCLYSYAPGEGNDWQFPFPNYENGDIFLSWGAVGVGAYASYKPELALKYVKNVLAQYAKDGLAYQRYGRAKQDGLGDDILSGNSLSVVGLFQGIYGINPRYNRLYLNPHITEQLAGTQVNYNFRNLLLTIELDVSQYAVSNGPFKIIAKTDFGFFCTDQELSYFHGNTSRPSLKVTTSHNQRLTLNIRKWEPNEIALTQSSGNVNSNKLVYQINDVKPHSYFSISINNKTLKRVKSSAQGTLVFEHTTNKTPDEIVILNDSK